MTSRVRLSGFTLVELLVVIAIIAVLAMLLVPVVAQSKAKARAIQCRSNIRQTLLAFHMYTEDNENFPYDFLWWQQVAPYVAVNATKMGPEGKIPLWHVWHCPGDKAFWAPTVNYTQAWMSYAPNSFGCGSWPGTVGALGLLKAVDDSGKLTSIRASEVAQPCEMVAFGDAYASTVGNQITRSSRSSLIGVNKVPNGDESWNWIRYLTHRQLNVGFVDGHSSGFDHQKLLLEKSETAWLRWNRDARPHLDADPILPW
jgi:prepilin-type N-terminal cleavage/methylation domain-containing protein/prepilin-type processing-associated H-X9-DG protein